MKTNKKKLRDILLIGYTSLLRKAGGSLFKLYSLETGRTTGPVLKMLVFWKGNDHSVLPVTPADPRTCCVSHTRSGNPVFAPAELRRPSLPRSAIPRRGSVARRADSRSQWPWRVSAGGACSSPSLRVLPRLKDGPPRCAPPPCTLVCAHHGTFQFPLVSEDCGFGRTTFSV